MRCCDSGIRTSFSCWTAELQTRRSLRRRKPHHSGSTIAASSHSERLSAPFKQDSAATSAAQAKENVRVEELKQDRMDGAGMSAAQVLSKMLCLMQILLRSRCPCAPSAITQKELLLALNDESGTHCWRIQGFKAGLARKLAILF